LPSRRKATPAQVALLWILAQKPWIVPIPGTTKLHRLQENIGGADVELSADDLRKLDEATAKINIQGARYPEQLQKMVGR
jgi:aryl-alcohol dehydrogenase-like predicted oxidoreductase